MVLIITIPSLGVIFKVWTKARNNLHRIDIYNELHNHKNGQVMYLR